METVVIFIIITVGFVCVLHDASAANVTYISPTSPQCSTVSVHEHEVYNRIFKNTSTFWSRPLKNSRLPIWITISFVLSKINDISERDGTLTLTGFAEVEWQDELHAWNSSLPDGCLGALHLPITDVWVPELTVVNSRSKYELHQSGGNEKVKVFSNGTSSYRPGGTLIVYCKFDLTYMPFDEQICSLQLESWRFSVDYQRLVFGKRPFSIFYWIENEQWEFGPVVRYRQSFTQYLSDQNYDHLTYEFSVRRKTGYYWMNVLVPSMFISIAKLGVFTLPIDHVIKIHVQFTCLLAYGVFQLMIVNDIPRTSDHIPLLSIYIDLSMAYICLAILGEGLTFACLRISHDRKRLRRVPDWLFTTSKMLAGPLLIKQTLTLQRHERQEKTPNKNCLENKPKTPPANSSQQEVPVIQQTQFPEIKVTACYSSVANSDPFLPESCSLEEITNCVALQKWRFLADIIDRLTFVVYLCCTVFTPIIMFLTIPKAVGTI